MALKHFIDDLQEIIDHKLKAARNKTFDLRLGHELNLNYSGKRIAAIMSEVTDDSTCQIGLIARAITDSFDFLLFWFSWAPAFQY